ncbi:hypothetical protein PG990_000327 [Apiospora arundinis]|uniref:Uncharacterized protein n=1 Tax=Apiospora arundinis TaxID=335852 RepID=A0ABR2HZ43_9PEZI
MLAVHALVQLVHANPRKPGSRDLAGGQDLEVTWGTQTALEAYHATACPLRAFESRNLNP